MLLLETIGLLQMSTN